MSVVVAWAAITIGGLLAYVIGLLGDLWDAFAGAYQVYMLGLLVFMSVRFLLAPWVTAQLNGGSSDRARKGGDD